MKLTQSYFDVFVQFKEDGIVKSESRNSDTIQNFCSKI